MTAALVPLPVADKCPFPVESQVALKGGSVVMTVVDTFPPTKAGKQWFVAAAWHDDAGVPQEASYPTGALQDAQEEDRPVVAKTRRRTPRRDLTRWSKKKTVRKT